MTSTIVVDTTSRDPLRLYKAPASTCPAPELVATMLEMLVSLREEEAPPDRYDTPPLTLPLAVAAVMLMKVQDSWLANAPVYTAIAPPYILPVPAAVAVVCSSSFFF